MFDFKKLEIYLSQLEYYWKVF